MAKGLGKAGLNFPRLTGGLQIKNKTTNANRMHGTGIGTKAKRYAFKKARKQK